jgi:hypothetical protein
MNIGDRVRLVHGREEGIITKVLPNNIVEVEIEDGFRIPVKRNEAVVISELEQKVFKAPVASSPTFEPQRSIYDRVGQQLPMFYRTKVSIWLLCLSTTVNFLSTSSTILTGICRLCFR